MSVNLFEWIQNTKAQTDYTEWLAHPVTQLILEGSRSANYTKPLQTPNGDLALQTVGLNAGRDITINRMSSLLDEVLPEETSFDAARINSLVADGYSAQEAEKMLAKEDAEED